MAEADCNPHRNPDNQDCADQDDQVGGEKCKYKLVRVLKLIGGPTKIDTHDKKEAREQHGGKTHDPPE